jgi:polyhydroxyalkanoate synthesis regulator protein
MTETAHRKRGGRAFHSVLESHFDFIHQLRQRRKTWKEIAESLLAEKGIRVTLYAPYRFYRRQLRRHAKGHREIMENNSQFQPAPQNVATKQPQKRPSPLPPKPVFKQPNLSNINTEQEFT